MPLRAVHTVHHRLRHGRAREARCDTLAALATLPLPLVRLRLRSADGRCFSGPKFRVALRVAKDKIFKRLPCSHSGTYADDCICQRVQQHRCYIVATNDKDLKRRIRKIPGVPIMFVANHRYQVERMPDKLEGGAGHTRKF